MVKKIILSVKSLVRTYGEGRAKTEAVKGISFDVEEGEFVALSGPSGSGKSTTFHQIALLDKPTSGIISFSGHNILNLGEDEKSDFRLKKIGYVFQHYELLPELTAIENIFLLLMVDCGITKEIKQKSEKILKEMGLLERKNHYPSELSGGEQQRIAIARALIKEPEIILADEPTANLDSLAGIKIMETLKELNKKKGITIFVINHERAFEKYFDRIIRLKDGKVERIDKK
jgi:putative ABC transport system ATP-binding protein